ncbi:biliverdin-producing heme oxygenase [Caulobacter hibisci]|uniref:Biliverdin-producing heme oxygenase n=1 Tax=Caulobacter hibisci TaxID=2035993 RepID=A0ABS0SX37_9CAUL|nr:biliverdin-producing heme oxygenase [Caulobacter hibisci]MBI1684169.1 biliverdin-producing heme oxygenase [Caulobacter hibisci]
MLLANITPLKVLLMTASCSLAISRRARLRAVTADLHDSIDSEISRTGLMTTRDGYVAYLNATLAARAKIEALLDASGAAEVYAPWSRISAALRQDVADLGEKPSFGDPGAPAPTPLGVAGIWGALYVLEGSAMGARLLLRRAAGLGFTGQFGARHLAQQTSGLPWWRHFVSALDEAPMTALQETACLDSAIATFACFDRAYASMNDRQT